MTPGTIETIKMLAGVANAERISAQNKMLAEGMLTSLLKIVEKDVQVASLKSHDIVTAPPSFDP